MSLRIRQIVLVARDLEATVDTLTKVLDIDVVYRDPLVAQFGLHNALMRIGDQFLEVVSPLREGTAAGRVLDRRGESGYMLILQTDDFATDRTRLDRFGVRVVWETTHDDIRAMHLHPKDIGGTIVSLDQPIPASSWRWAGPDWRQLPARGNANRIIDAEVEAIDPDRMAHRWADVLGRPSPIDEGETWRIDLNDGAVRFVSIRSRPDGISAFTLAANDPHGALTAARKLGLPTQGNKVILCGTRFLLQGNN